MKWTEKHCAYGTSAYVDETRVGHWGGPGCEIGSLTTYRGAVTILLHRGIRAEERHIGNVNPYSQSKTDELYRQARGLVEDFVNSELRRHDEWMEKWNDSLRKTP